MNQILKRCLLAQGGALRSGVPSRHRPCGVATSGPAVGLTLASVASSHAESDCPTGNNASGHAPILVVHAGAKIRLDKPLAIPSRISLTEQHKQSGQIFKVHTAVAVDIGTPIELRVAFA